MFEQDTEQENRMSEEMQDNRAFQTSSRSRKRVKRQRPWLMIPLILLLLMICAALFLAVRYAIKALGSGQTQPSVVTTQAPTLASETPAASSSEDNATQPQTASSQAETTSSEAATAPSQTNSTEPASSQSGADAAFHLYTAAELLPVPDGIERGFFTDVNAEDKNGSWWFGRRTRNLQTGEVTVEYERNASTLETLREYGAIYRKNENEKVAYLTFDCGYEYGHTATILDTLKEKNVKAVFFVAGDFVNDAKNKELLLRMFNEGHVIGSHTDHHPIMPNQTDEGFIDELNGLQLKVNDLLGVDYQIHYYRPPEGSTCERDLYLARKMDITTVLWSYAYGDYNVNNQPEVAASLEKAKIGLHDGCVYLLHAVSSTNASMLGDLIDYIHGEGYELRRIDQ